MFLSRTTSGDYGPYLYIILIMCKATLVLTNREMLHEVTKSHPIKTDWIF